MNNGKPAKFNWVWNKRTGMFVIKSYVCHRVIYDAYKESIKRTPSMLQ